MNKISIILTTTVNVTKHSAFQVDKNERINTYLKSIISWLENTDLNIIVVENSGYLFEELKNELNLYHDKFELITFDEKEQKYEGYQMLYNQKEALK
jgi:succinylglutamate desuccinylase